MSYKNNYRSSGRSDNRSRNFRSSSARPKSRYNKSRRSRGANKQYINPSKFIHKAKPKEEVVSYQPEHKFVDFPFGAEIQYNIKQKGYDKPSAIQDQAIPHIIAGKDVIGLANTGTGKTAAFLLPIIERQRGISLSPGAIIISPTRELAQQINEQFIQFSHGTGLKSTLIVGGTNIDRQIRELRRRPSVIVGTPGRLKDLLNRNMIQLKNINTLVLDEADRMLDMGFLPDIRHIVSSMPKARQSLFFSATITPDIEVLVKDFLNDPVTVSVRTGDTSEYINQDVVKTRDKAHKIEVLIEMIGRDDCEKVLVFGETKFGVQRLSDNLTKQGIASVAIHGNKNQSQRKRALKEFKGNRAKVLVATDVAARGLDIPNVSHVINFDTPQTYEDYIHRIGRTGRAETHGQAYTFI